MTQNAGHQRAAERYDLPPEGEDERHYMAAEIDGLRARIAALEAAGDALVEVVSSAHLAVIERWRAVRDA